MKAAIGRLLLWWLHGSRAEQDRIMEEEMLRLAEESEDHRVYEHELHERLVDRSMDVMASGRASGRAKLRLWLGL